MPGQEQNPTEAWNGAVRYYGDLSSRPDWKWVRPIFELAKQISTSRVSTCFVPSIVDDGLELSREGEGGPERSLRITITRDGRLLLQRGSRGETKVAEHSCSIEAGFPTITAVLKGM